MLPTLKYLLPAALLMIADGVVLAQTKAPATASKTLEAVKAATKSDKSDAKSEQSTTATTATTAPTPTSAGDGEAKAEALEGLRLAPTGRRDPFRPITLNVRATSRPRENLSPLERFEIGQLKLVGVVWNVKEPTALVEDSSGLGYMVKVGTPIGSNDGKIKEVRRDSLIVEEFFVDLYGAKKRREVSMRLAVEQ